MKFYEIHINLDRYNMTWRTQMISSHDCISVWGEKPLFLPGRNILVSLLFMRLRKVVFTFSGKTNDIQFQVSFFPICCSTNSIKYKQVNSLRLFNQNTTQKNKFVACHRLFTSIMINFINLLTS